MYSKIDWSSIGYKLGHIAEGVLYHNVLVERIIVIIFQTCLQRTSENISHLSSCRNECHVSISFPILNIYCFDTECADNPCENGGTCFELLSGYMCNCPPGFTFRNCHKILEINPTETGIYINIYGNLIYLRPCTLAKLFQQHIIRKIQPWFLYSALLILSVFE